MNHISAFILLLFALSVSTIPCTDFVVCETDPCTPTTCLKSENCIANYCGSCSARCVCQSNSDCKNNEICTDSYCQPHKKTVGEGKSCGGTTQCDSDLVCTTLPGTTHDEGTCRKKCHSNSECSDNEYCSSNSVCIPGGDCFKDTDCSNKDNHYVENLPFCSPNSNLITYCAQSSGTCVGNCGQPISCKSAADCPSTYTCNYQTNECAAPDYCQTNNGCEGQPMPLLLVLCPGGTIAQTVCNGTSASNCHWALQPCPTTCNCSGMPLPPIAICPGGEQRSPYCGKQNDGSCGYIVPPCNNTKPTPIPFPPACDCSTYPIPDIAKKCDDGSYTTPTCVQSPTGCTTVFQCPNNTQCTANGNQCSNSIGGSCLGVCENEQCILNAYDSCLELPAVVFSISLKESTPSSSLVSDLSNYSSLPKSDIHILQSTNSNNVVEFVDSSKITASNALEKLKNNINNGEAKASSLDAAKIVVLSSDVVDHPQGNDDSSSASQPVMFVTLLFVSMFMLF